MNNKSNRFGVDLVTFSHPAYWGVTSFEEINLLATEEPKQFWLRMLDDVAQTGVTGIELTFAPFSWQGAKEAFGGIEAFTLALAQRGLSISSGFFASLERTPNIADESVRTSLLNEAQSCAEFLQACGADVMVIGCPLRPTLGEMPIEVFGFDQAQKLAEFLNQLGALLHTYGVRLALHTEVSTIFAMPRDVQLMMLLTDPYYVHLCPDSAHILLAGGDPTATVQQHQSRIAISHWKDASGTFPSSIQIDSDIHDKHKPYFREFGTGDVDFDSWAKVILGKAENDWNILELDASPNPVSSIAHALKEVASIKYQ